MAQFFARIVMPRSFSMALESMIRSPTFSCAAKVPDCLSRQSTSVVLPWSTWAMMAMLRIGRCMGSLGVAPGREKGPREYQFQRGSAAQLGQDRGLRMGAPLWGSRYTEIVNRPPPTAPQSGPNLQRLPREFLEVFRYGRKALELV